MLFKKAIVIRLLIHYNGGLFLRPLASTRRMESSSIHDSSPKTPFRNRILTDEANVFEHNAWDNMVWDKAQEEAAIEKISKNSSQKMDDSRKTELQNNAASFWNEFYGKHQNKFFKDRHWLFIELPELKDAISTSQDGNVVNVLEVGCGVGNSVFPVLDTFKEKCFIYCCDFSAAAVDLVCSHEQYDSDRCKAFVWDITTECNDNLKPNSLDFILLIFVVSAINPKKFSDVFNNLYKYLKPGGIIFFRDYGLYDMVQLRFKPGQCIEDNFYARGDGTRVYFFSEDEVDKLLCNAGFEKIDLLTDRRLQVNRGKQLKMYRIWVMAKYRKPL